ncbi:DoxX family protein [Actinomadura alba]|uniref:DoxX family membrane protein n=1 Tax=Actinomadura alba TaxID=406431 RepID=A0ABR7LL37_9ACTN|nr:DoxX family protein [Actinomadura alba]MBC6465205.1 DoxX family membrane protein [Actinomadura alba]
MRTRPLYDYVALLARLGVGIVILAHGWQKIQVGITATSRDFDRLRVPAPTATAIYATFVELLGGVALILGLALPVVGLLLFVDMVGAFVFVHADNGVFLVNEGSVENGFELVLVLAVASLLFAAGGAGRFTVDRRLFPRRTAPPAPSSPAPADVPALPPGREPEPRPESTSGGTSRKLFGRSRSGRASAGASRAKAESTHETSGEAPEKPADPTGDRGREPGRAISGTPADPSTGDRPAAADPAGQPRLVSNIVEDASKDVLVAGRRKRRSTKKPAAGSGQAGTEPAKPPTEG